MERKESKRQTSMTLSVDRETINNLGLLKERLSKEGYVGRISKSAIVEFLIREAVNNRNLSAVFKK